MNNKPLYSGVVVLSLVILAINPISESAESAEFEVKSTTTKAFFFAPNDPQLKNHLMFDYFFPQTNGLPAEKIEQIASNLAAHCSPGTPQSPPPEGVGEAIIGFVIKEVASVVIKGTTSALKNSLAKYTHTFSSVAELKDHQQSPTIFSLYSGKSLNGELPQLNIRCFRIVKIEKDSSNPPQERLAMDFVGAIDQHESNPVTLRVRPLHLLYFAPQASTRKRNGDSKIAIGISLSMDVGWREDNKSFSTEKFVDLQFLTDSFTLEEIEDKGAIVRDYTTGTEPKSNGKQFLAPPSSKVNDNIFGKNAVRPTLSVIESGVERKYLRDIYEFLDENGADLEDRLSDKLKDLVDELNRDDST